MSIQEAQPQQKNASPTARQLAAALELPGSELPTAVYLSIIGAYTWMLAVAWIAFASPEDTDLDLAIVTVLAVIFFGVPLAIIHTAVGQGAGTLAPLRRFLLRPFDTYTVTMPAAQAWIEVAIIPVALALAATLFGLVYVLVG